MGIFGRYTRKSNNIFGKYGGKLSKKQFAKHLNGVGLQSWRKEYVKRVMERFDEPRYSRGITEEEFNKGLDEMTKNTKDRIDRRHIERIKKHF